MAAFSARRDPSSLRRSHKYGTVLMCVNYCRSVSAMGQGGALARTHEGEPGLPRGRNGLPTETVRAAQRERLLRPVIAAVAKTGFRRPHGGRHRARRPGVEVRRSTPTSPTRRTASWRLPARGRLLIDAGSRRGPAVARRGQPRGGAAGGHRGVPGISWPEPAFARAFYVDMPAAGPRAVRRIEAAQHTFAQLDRAWHERARRDHPDWPAVPDQAYYALAGATAELVRAQVRHGNIHAMPDLENTLVAFHLAVLAARPMDAPGTPGASTA